MDNIVFRLAPVIFFAPVITAFVVLPFSPYLTAGALGTGIIYYVALSSIDVIGVFMAGWGSNNKYALIGGLRSAAQMISYELPLVLALVGVVMLTSVACAGLHGANARSGDLRRRLDLVHADRQRADAAERAVVLVRPGAAAGPAGLLHLRPGRDEPLAVRPA